MFVNMQLASKCMSALDTLPFDIASCNKLIMEANGCRHYIQSETRIIEQKLTSSLMDMHSLS